MPQQLLDSPDVIARLEQVSRERVPQRVARRRPRDASGTYRILHGTLKDRLVQMMPAPLSSRLVHVEPGRGENPLPGPLERRVRVTACRHLPEEDALVISEVATPNTLNLCEKCYANTRRMPGA